MAYRTGIMITPFAPRAWSSSAARALLLDPGGRSGITAGVASPGGLVGVVMVREIVEGNSSRRVRAHYRVHQDELRSTAVAEGRHAGK